MDLAALGALGDSLSALGGIMMDRSKQKLAEQLEKDREDRADVRQQAKEAREQQRNLAVVQDWKPTQLPDGKWVEQGFNSEGKKISERAMDPSTIENIQFTRDKNKLTLEGLVQDIAAGNTKAKYADRSAEADIAAKEAQADYYRNYGNYYAAGGAKKNPPKETPYTDPAPQALKDAFGRDKKALAEFRKWRADQVEADPEYRNGAYSLDAYLSGKNATTTYNVNGKNIDIPAGREATVGGLADIILNRRREGKPALSRDELTGMAKSFRTTGHMQEPDALPPQALSQLQEGKTTTFRNGQVWTLQNGQPKRIK